MQANPSAYPEFTSNGFLKTNSTLFLFLHVAAKPLGLLLAAKIFVTLTIGAGAWVYPRLIERFAGAMKVGSATLLLWPIVHNWFIAMGMLDYALAVPLALETLVQLDAFRRTGSAWSGVAAALLALLVWYTHAFAIIVLALLVTVEGATALAARDHGARPWEAMRRLALPVLPAIALTGASAFVQLASETHVGALSTFFQGTLALLYGAWSEWLWSMSKWTGASLLVALCLAYFGVRRFRESHPFFSPAAFAVLCASYLVLPYHTHRWFYVGSRLLPFAWLAAALRVPAALPTWLRRVLVVGALTWSAGLGFEYRQTEHDWQAIRRAEIAIPEHARLLPLVFDRKGPHGENTWPMLHAWGLVVVDRQTTAPLLFAHSRSFPVTYTTEPPARFHQLNLEQFPMGMVSSAAYCREITREVVLDDCPSSYRAAWKEFWADAIPRFDRVLMYRPSDEVRAAIPSELAVVYDHEGVVVLAPASR